MLILLNRPEPELEKFNYSLIHKIEKNVFGHGLEKFYLYKYYQPIFNTQTEGKDYKLYYLGGQSNMDGFGFNSDLPEELNDTLKGVMIFHGNTSPDNTPVDGRGIWTELVPGHGAGFKSDGEINYYSERFGVELTFAQKLLDLDPGSNIAILKYSRGGTSIDFEARGRLGCWEPDFRDTTDVNQYDHFLAAVRYALSVKDIDGDGEEDRLIPTGIIWMQGESDAYFSEETANRYEFNLKRLMDLMRAAFRVDDLPVVIGQITDSGQDEDDGKVWKKTTAIRRTVSNKDFVFKTIVI
ncbi:sialate O-acetylesterase [Bacteroidota bacterium]